MTTILKILATAEEIAISRLAFNAGINEVKGRIAAAEAELESLEWREVGAGEAFDVAIADLAALGLEAGAAERLINDRISVLRAAGVLEAVVPNDGVGATEATAEKSTRRRRAKKEEAAAEPEVENVQPQIEPQTAPSDGTAVSQTQAAESPHTPVAEVSGQVEDAPLPDAGNEAVVNALADGNPSPAGDEKPELDTLPDFIAAPEKAPQLETAPGSVVTPEAEMIPDFVAVAGADDAAASESIIDTIANGADASTIWGSDGPSDADLEDQLAASRSQDGSDGNQTTAASRVNRPQAAAPVEDKAYGDDVTQESAGKSPDFDFLNFSAAPEGDTVIPDWM